MKFIYLAIASFLFSFSFGQYKPGKAQEQAIWIKNTTLHLGTGKALQNAHIVFENGKITYVGEASPKASNARVIDANNKHVYPGFIATNSTLGLLEIGAVKASRDTKEVGSDNPNVRSIVAYNAESKITETVRPNGVLLAQISPRGGTWSGTSSIVQLDAWNWEDAVVKKDDGLHLNWPRLWGNATSTSYKKRKENYEKALLGIEQFMQRAQAYNGKERNLKLQAMQGILKGEQTLYVHVNWAQNILRAIALKTKFDIPKMVIVGGYDAVEVADELIKNNIPVLARRVHELPWRPDDDLEKHYNLPVDLQKAGVVVGLENDGDMAEMNTRNYPFYLGTLVGHGMDYEEAVKISTLNAAKILGISDTYGSLEVGKSATLFISKGDALDIRRNKLEHAFIDGRALDLKTFQTRLYEKYGEKLGVETP